jgi:hypothetical protein
MRPARPRTVRLLAVIAVGALALAGCSSSGGSSASSPSATSNGVSDLTADQILAKTNEAAKSQSSVHLVGKGSSDGAPFALDMKLRKGGGGVGSVTQGTDTIQIITTGTDIYLKADKAYWARTGTAAAAELIGTRWVKAPASNASFEQLAKIGDFSSSLDGFLKPSGTITKGDQSTVDGQAAIALVSSSGKLWVATTGSPLPIKIESGTSGEGLTFGEWGATVDVPIPADSDVIDITKLQGS